MADSQLRILAEMHELRGDASKAGGLLSWSPQVRFNRLVAIMVEADLDVLLDKTPPT